MPLSTEVEYWDKIALKSVAANGNKWSFVDNAWKRYDQIKRLFRYDWIGHKILEIGAGNGIIAYMLRLLGGDEFDYTGTELSERFRAFAANIYNLRTVSADVRELPDGPYSRIIAFDSLEHVQPDHRPAGYRRIAQVAAPGALFFLHYSYGHSYHDKRFDHPFGLDDIVAIERNEFTLLTYDRYPVDHPLGVIEYAFAVFRKNDESRL